MDIEERLKGLATQFNMDVERVRGIFNRHMQNEKVVKYDVERRAKIALLFTRQELMKLKASITVNFIPIGVFVERQYGTDMLGFILKSNEETTVEPFVLRIPVKYQKFVEDTEFFAIYSLSYRDAGRNNIYTSAEFLKTTNITDEISFIKKFWNIVELNGLREGVSKQKRCEEEGKQIPDPLRKLFLFAGIVERKRRGTSKKGTQYVVVEVSDETLPVREELCQDEEGNPVVVTPNISVWLHHRFDIMNEGDVCMFLGTLQRGNDAKLFANACNVWMIE
ncbi:MAG: hypothetical protein EJNHJLOP_00061 [Methanophagales virus PBV082]|uniref:Uncharacterized protein n=1 Tax=Methanophagales virus PBV082 TaxID=3071307 RepID=A0AA46TDI0_9VIRU|nr:MAG: hypothetical protein QIT52_gp61 [Methanophagales virus PBV082]UYL64950.1 MAG: hypothetical protein EJNHJLOP_00061 [Methanophagales virus PBV082]